MGHQFESQCLVGSYGTAAGIETLEPMRMLIPRVFHQVWLGGDRLPDEFARYQQTWLRFNPGWDLKLWTEDNLPSGLIREEAYERLRSPVERCDILRLELPLRFGGIYLDCDFECLRPIEPILDGVEFFVGLTRPDRVNHAIMGSIPGHPILRRALELIRPRDYFGYDKEATGPVFFNELLNEFPDATVFDKSYFYAIEEEARATGYAVHHEAVSWKSNEELRVNLRKARDQEQKWRKKALELREQNTQLEARLRRLQRPLAPLLKLRRMTGSRPTTRHGRRPASDHHPQRWRAGGERRAGEMVRKPHF
jgi:hypothetical protein